MWVDGVRAMLVYRCNRTISACLGFNNPKRNGKGLSEHSKCYGRSCLAVYQPLTSHAMDQLLPSVGVKSPTEDHLGASITEDHSDCPPLRDNTSFDLSMHRM
jgi:hypothetical protein